NLNILICANILNARKILEEKYIRLLSQEEQAYARRHLGLVETLVIGVAIAPSEAMLREDELVVFTDSYPTLIADARGFRGEAPKLENVRYVEDIHAEEVRKMYTYNMAHAFLAYLGGAKGHTKVYEAITDPQILVQLRAALEEASQGLSAEFGFDGQEMRAYCEQVIGKFSNPVLEDTLVRVGKGVGRKIARDERLVGPALICRKHGIYPYYLAKAVAYAMRFNNPEDTSLAQIALKMQQGNRTDSVMEICGLDSQRDFAYLVARHYLRHNGTLTDEDARKVSVLKAAFSQGFHNEKKFRGCAQAALLALFAVNGDIDKPLFQAASGLSGGMAITGDGSCGGYTAGILYTSKFSGRRYDEMLAHGDKQEQYNSYDMAQSLNDRFNACYGSVICADIHRKIFGGKAYCLRTKEVRNQFEEAGAHQDKCTAVVANSCVWAMEALWEKGLQLPQA
ncbi:MAG: C-GCAxxG-C-C family (seleno)protein, partial [Eubacteriales bacterium]|nr:C-GCAxxG-C-C family (seleno)protein [Eubacteriales bacterium]